jgi:hypothetical protein
MSTFDRQPLFATGPHTFHVAGLELRHADQPAPDPGYRGHHLLPQGIGPRPITQHGDLLADSPDDLRQQVARIEAMLDGRACELIDHLGRSWPHTVMLSFEPQSPVRVGPRLRLSYVVRYRQTRP